MKKFADLTVEELEKVFDANDQLREEVEDDYQESQMDYISDILESMKDGLSNWEVGYGSRPIIQYRDERELFEATLEACDSFGFLSEEYTKKVKYYLGRCDVLDGMDYENRQFKGLEEYIERAGSRVAEEIVSTFEQILDYSDSDIRDYFLDFYSNARMEESDGFYVDDEYTLFQHVEYEKSFQTKKRAAC